MANVLIVYYYMQHPIRATIRDHLYSFRRYSSHRCCYLNLAVGDIPWYVKRMHWDLVIFHTVFLSSRFARELFVRNMQKLDFFRGSDAIKIALPQDEFINMDLVCGFINEFGVSHVFSVAPESEWPLIYRTVDFQKARFHKVLTGYIDEALIKKVDRLARAMPDHRPVDIGYRAYRAAFWFGLHGTLKWRIADVFQAKAPRKGLVIDISTRDEDVIPGDDWYRFLLRCKYQLGVEGGSSLLDWDGTYRRRTEEYISQHPGATFEETQEVCFGDADGGLKYFAISPRHFESCVTRTCQVLVEGDYDGVLSPGKHYIQLKRDFSNLDQVLDTIARDELRDEITTRAWGDIVESGRYTYSAFVNYVIDSSLPNSPSKPRSAGSAPWAWVIYCWMALREKLSWLAVAAIFAPWMRRPLTVIAPVAVRLRRLVYRSR